MEIKSLAQSIIENRLGKKTDVPSDVVQESIENPDTLKNIADKIRSEYGLETAVSKSNLGGGEPTYFMKVFGPKDTWKNNIALNSPFHVMFRIADGTLEMTTNSYQVRDAKAKMRKTKYSNDSDLEKKLLGYFSKNKSAIKGILSEEIDLVKKAAEILRMKKEKTDDVEESRLGLLNALSSGEKRIMKKANSGKGKPVKIDIDTRTGFGEDEMKAVYSLKRRGYIEFKKIGDTSFNISVTDEGKDLKEEYSLEKAIEMAKKTLKGGDRFTSTVGLFAKDDSFIPGDMKYRDKMEKDGYKWAGVVNKDGSVTMKRGFKESVDLDEALGNSDYVMNKSDLAAVQKKLNTMKNPPKVIKDKAGFFHLKYDGGKKVVGPYRTMKAVLDALEGMKEDIDLDEAATKMDLMKALDKEFPNFKVGKIADTNKVAKFLEKQGFKNKGAMNAALDFENYKKGTFKETMDEAVLRGRDYEVKDDGVHISKANFRKIHKDYKVTRKGDEMMMVNGGAKGSILVPVIFTESKNTKLPKHLAKFLDKDGNPNKEAQKRIDQGRKEKDKAKDVTPKGYGPNEAKSATGYEIYHKDFSSAVQHAISQVEKKGYTVDEDEWDRKVALGPKKPSKGKSNSYSIALLKNGKETKRNLQMQVYYDEGRYELNMYIS